VERRYVPAGRKGRKGTLPCLRRGAGEEKSSSEAGVAFGAAQRRVADCFVYWGRTERES